MGLGLMIRFILVQQSIEVEDKRGLGGLALAGCPVRLLCVSHTLRLKYVRRIYKTVATYC